MDINTVPHHVRTLEVAEDMAHQFRTIARAALEIRELALEVPVEDGSAVLAVAETVGVDPDAAIALRGLLQMVDNWCDRAEDLSEDDIEMLGFRADVDEVTHRCGWGQGE